MKDGLIRDVSHELKTPVAKQAMQPIAEPMRPIDGTRCRVSSMPSPYTRSYGTYTSSDPDPVAASTLWARSSTLIRSGEPTL